MGSRYMILWICYKIKRNTPLTFDKINNTFFFYTLIQINQLRFTTCDNLFFKIFLSHNM